MITQSPWSGGTPDVSRQDYSAWGLDQSGSGKRRLITPYQGENSPEQAALHAILMERVRRENASSGKSSSKPREAESIDDQAARHSILRNRIRREFAFSGKSGSMESKAGSLNMSEVDAKIAAAEARTDTKIAKIDARFDLLMQKLDGIQASMSDIKSDNASTRSTVRNSAFALAGLIVAIAALMLSAAAMSPFVYQLGRDSVSQPTTISSHANSSPDQTKAVSNQSEKPVTETTQRDQSAGAQNQGAHPQDQKNP